MTWQSSTIDPAITSPSTDISKIKNDLQVLRARFAGTADADVPVSFPAAGIASGAGRAPDFRATRQLIGSDVAFGTNLPTGDAQHLCEIVNDNTAYQVWSMASYGSGGVFQNNMHFNRARGSAAAPTAVQAGDYFLSQGFRGWDASGAMSQSYAAAQVIATENWTSAAHGIKFHWEVTKTAGSTRYPAMDLYAAGTDSVVLQLGDGSSLFSRVLNASNTGALQSHGSLNQAGAQSILYGSAHATAPSESWVRASRHVLQDVSGTEAARLTTTGLSLTGADATYKLEVKANSGQANVFNVSSAAGGAMLYASKGTGTYSSGENAANAALYVRKDSTTSRSIACAGTVSASGADYAEYMRKGPTCGDLAKGQIVGIGDSGLLTDRWDEAVSFVVKSTDPSYVGGDTWGDESVLGVAMPVEPMLAQIPYTGADHPGAEPAKPGDYDEPTKEPAPINAPRGAGRDDRAAVAALNAARAADYQAYLRHRLERIESYDEAAAAYAQALQRYEADRAAYEAEVAAALAHFESVTMPAYRAELDAFNAAHEAARARVDRIAFCGQVPVNVTGAKPGDYIVPVASSDGGIDAIAVHAPSFDQYREAVGRVIKIGADGRPVIIVKVS